MKVEKEQLDKVQMKLTIEVDEDTFAEAQENAFKEKKKNISIPGFRKGHAPRALIEQHYGKDYFYFDAAENCVYPAYIQAMNENEEIKAISQPSFDIVQLEVGKPFIFTAIIETKQELDLPEYKGLEIEKIDTEVAEEDIQKELDHIRNNTALYEEKTGDDAVVEDGDIVILDFEGKKDDVPFEGGKAENYELTIGSNSFIPGFEEGMLGMRLGEEKDLELTFPEAYHSEELAGAEVVFSVRVNEIKTKQLQPLDDEFAKDVSEFETLDELKNDIKSGMQKAKEEQAQQQYKQKVSDMVTSATEVVAPQSMVEKESENFLNDMSYNLRSQGLELEQYLKFTGGSMDDLKKECDTRAEVAVKQQVVLAEIAEREGIDVSEEEMNEEYGRLAELYQMEVDQLKQIFMIQGQAEALRRNILMEKTVEFLLKEAVIG